MTAMSGMTEIKYFGRGVGFQRDSVSSLPFLFEFVSFALIML